MCWSQVLPRRLCPLRRACRTAARTSSAPDKALGGHQRLCQCGHSLRLAARLAVPQQHPHLPRPAVWRAWIDAPPRWRGTPEERRDYYQPANPKQRAGAMPLSLAAPAASTRSGGLATHFDASTGVAELWLARPAKGNALDGALWAALPEAVARLAEDDAVRCVLVCGEGRHFCTGIDLGHLTATMAGGGNGSADEGRRREALRRGILRMQQSISCLEELRCPVVAAVHGACYGAGEGGRGRIAAPRQQCPPGRSAGAVARLAQPSHSRDIDSLAHTRGFGSRTNEPSSHRSDACLSSKVWTW